LAVSRRYFLDPFGCVKNQVDAENMMARLDGSGWSSVPEAGDADLIIVNSCGFVEDAKRESIDAVLGWRGLYPDKKILLAGCLAQRYAKELAESLPEADGFFGTDDIAKIADAADSLGGGGEGPTPGVQNEAPAAGSRPLLSMPGSAYVKISEGCDNGCTYCAIPLIRGPLRCRSVEDILDECKGLLARGIKELCIVGQDIASYSSGGSGLPELLAAMAELRGDFWVRLLYMHPDRFPLRVLDVMERDARFLPYFDVPFQHASGRILSAMNRRGNAEDYLALAQTIRGRLPGSVIRTTFLVGFPGETDADFAELRAFQDRLRPDWLGCFSYSREEGTAAYSMPGRVPKKKALARKLEVEESQLRITEENMDRFVGQTLDVLLEEKFDSSDRDGNDEETPELWLGRAYCHAPEVDGSAVIVGPLSGAEKAGGLLPCKVIARRSFDLELRPVSGV